jgi:hypothetical protein
MGLSVLTLTGAVGFGGLATAAEASTVRASQYGPPPGATPPLPGFTSVLTSVTVGPAGGIIGPVSCDGAADTLTVPAGAFPADVQITLTCGSLAALTGSAFSGFTLDAALGVQVDLNGATFPGTFLKALTLTSVDPRYVAGSVVGIWNGTSLMPFTNETSAPGVVTVSFDTDPDLEFLSPASQAEQPVPKATVPVTGKPVVGEGILAGALLVAGAGGLTVRRRRARS